MLVFHLCCQIVWVYRNYAVDSCVCLTKWWIRLREKQTPKALKVKLSWLPIGSLVEITGGGVWTEECSSIVPVWITSNWTRKNGDEATTTRKLSYYLLDMRWPLHLLAAFIYFLIVLVENEGKIKCIKFSCYIFFYRFLFWSMKILSFYSSLLGSVIVSWHS